MSTIGTLVPQRTQYPFAALTDSQLKSILGINQPLSRRLFLQNQWDTFERIENFNDVIYQQFQQGNRSNLYYQFKNDEEFKNYKAGQQLHVNAYPSLPVSTFAAVRDRPMPDVPILTGLPLDTGVPRFQINTITPTASEKAQASADLEVYAYVSTYNATHYLKYAFPDDVEKNAFERGELAAATVIPYTSS
jgi:hypothetical protein